MAWFEIIVGPMRSGKTKEEIRQLEVLEVAGKRILVAKPKRDDRTGAEIAARGRKEKSTFPAFPIESEEELSSLLSKNPCDVLAVDEAQFFGDWFAVFIKKLLEENKNEDFAVIVAGLDLDTERKKFEPVCELIPWADEILRLKAVCNRCRQMPPNAIFTKKIGGTPGQRIEVGDGIYEARCRCCYLLD